MAEGLGNFRGGIRSLLEIWEDQGRRRALEADLIGAGMRLRFFGSGDPAYEWGDLAAFVAGLPRSSALSRHILGDEAQWDLNEDLLALVADNLTIIRYALTSQKGDPPPVFVSRGARADASKSATQEADKDGGDLNDRNVSGAAVGEVWSTEETARQLGWA